MSNPRKLPPPSPKSKDSTVYYIRMRAYSIISLCSIEFLKKMLIKFKSFSIWSGIIVWIIRNQQNSRLFKPNVIFILLICLRSFPHYNIALTLCGQREANCLHSSTVNEGKLTHNDFFCKRNSANRNPIKKSTKVTNFTSILTVAYLLLKCWQNKVIFGGLPVTWACRWL